MIFLSVALVAIGLGWYVDRLAYRDSTHTPDKFVDIGFALGKASESTMIYAMQDKDNLPEDPNSFAHVRERELILNVLSMASAHRTITRMGTDDPDDSIPEWRADKARDFAASSLALLNVSKLQEFQTVFENHGWDTEFVNAYKSDDGSLTNDLVTFLELALSKNVERPRVHDE